MRDSVLIINAGSSSIKFAVYAVADAAAPNPSPQLRGQIADISGDAAFYLTDADDHTQRLDDRHAATNHLEAIDQILTWIPSRLAGATLIGAGHRVVHGGPRHNVPCLIIDRSFSEL